MQKVHQGWRLGVVLSTPSITPQVLHCMAVPPDTTSQLQGSCGLAAGLHFYQVGCFAQSELGWVLTSCMEQGSLIPSWHRCSWDFAAPVLLHAPAQVCQVWGAERRLLGAALPWDVLGWAWSRQAAELDALNHAYVCMHVLRRHTLPVCLECH